MGNFIFALAFMLLCFTLFLMSIHGFNKIIYGDYPTWVAVLSGFITLVVLASFGYNLGLFVIRTIELVPMIQNGLI